MAKKKGAPPALTIGLLGLILVSAGVFGWAFLRKERIEAQPAEITTTTNETEWDAILKKIGTARSMFRETMALNRDEAKVDLFKQKLDESIVYIRDVQTEIDAMLDDVRLPNGDLPPEYNGYNQQAKDLVMMMMDLSRAQGFGISSPEGEE